MTRSTHRGFSMLIAIACIAFVGLALALVARVVTNDARGTGREIVETQQRQMLLAGLRIAEARLDADALAVGALPTPIEVNVGLRIESIDRPSADRAVVTMQASVGESTLVERETYGRAAGSWRLVGAEIVR